MPLDIYFTINMNSSDLHLKQHPYKSWSSNLDSSRGKSTLVSVTVFVASLSFLGAFTISFFL